jgi:hypothetical protein
MSLAKQSFGSSPKVSFAKASSIPYATIGVRLGSGPQSLAVLGSNNNGEELWAVSKDAVIVMQNGRIMRTAGLPHDLSWSTLVSVNGRMPSAQPWTSRRKLTWTVDFRDKNLTAVSVNCIENPIRFQRIVILGKAINTLRVESNCESPSLGWRFKNTYWVSRTSNIVWRSIQHIHPDMDPIEIEVFRPPA